jgi:DNA-binding NarL/FixJ family response regulator
VTKALQAGIRGYVLKVDAGEELIPAVHEVSGGGKYLSQGVRAKWTE